MKRNLFLAAAYLASSGLMITSLYFALMQDSYETAWTYLVYAIGLQALTQFLDERWEKKHQQVFQLSPDDAERMLRWLQTEENHR